MSETKVRSQVNPHTASLHCCSLTEARWPDLTGASAPETGHLADSMPEAGVQEAEIINLGPAQFRAAGIGFWAARNGFWAARSGFWAARSRLPGLDVARPKLSIWNLPNFVLPGVDSGLPGVEGGPAEEGGRRWERI